MPDEDVRNLEVPSVVAAIRDPDKLAALERMLQDAHFFETLEAVRSKTGKSKQDFLIVMKPNFMMAIKVEDPPLVYTDPVLVERWLEKIREAGYTRLRVVEAQNVYNLWYRNRSVNHVARVLGFSRKGYEVRDQTNEQFPYDYGGDLGNHFVGERAWSAVQRTSGSLHRPVWCVRRKKPPRSVSHRYETTDVQHGSECPAE